MLSFSLFKKINLVIEKIDQFFKVLDDSSHRFQQAINIYLENNVNIEFFELLQIISQNEKTADQLLKDIEQSLYKYALIPEIRFDTMRLIQRSDDIQDMLKELVVKFELERPNIPDDLKLEFKKLSETSIIASQHACWAAANFFRTPSEAKKHIEHALEYEHKADAQAEHCKRLIFQQLHSISLAEKIQIRYFIEKIEAVSDLAQSVAYTVNLIILKRFE